jgi:FtsH-binding integral membrane protein
MSTIAKTFFRYSYNYVNHFHYRQNVFIAYDNKINVFRRDFSSLNFNNSNNSNQPRSKSGTSTQIQQKPSLFQLFKNFSSFTSDTSNKPSKLNTSNEITPSLQTYFKKVGFTSGKLLGTSLVSGITTIGAASVLSNYVMLSPLMCGSLWFGAVIAGFYNAYQISNTSKTNEQRLLNAYLLHGCMGITIAPSLFIFSQFIPHALILSSALTMGPITAALTMKKGSMLKYGPALYTGLWGLIGIGAMSIVAPLLGFNSFGLAMHSIDMVGGVALFSAYNAYDTHVLIKDFEEGREDHIGHAVNYSLNAINIFIRILEIIAKSVDAIKGNN